MDVIRYPSPELWPELARRPEIEAGRLNAAAAAILEQVKAEGDAGIRELSRKFDGVDLADLELPSEQVRAGAAACTDHIKKAIDLSVRNVAAFHRAQSDRPLRIETAPGVVCWRKSLPIERVGIYVPGGSAPLFSTVIMLAVPARLAGCREVIMCTPPAKGGSIDPAMLYAALTAGVDRVFRVGGAQAIAALAFGTQSVPRVQKIFGPGNQYVTAAKRLVAAYTDCAIDMPAGPTELLIIADRSCRPAFVAADLLSQAEHGPDSQVILAACAESVIAAVEIEMERQLQALPRREIAEKALRNAHAVLFASLDEAMGFSNLYAPEHLILAVEDAEQLADRVTSAGSVFVGSWSTESFGDYTAGVNHTLPTGGAARAYSGVSLDSFLKKVTFQRVDALGVKSLGAATEVMAEAEGLAAHAAAVRLRTAEADPGASSFSAERLVRENVRDITPYSCARYEHAGGGILLDANENAIGSAGVEQVNRYPDPYQTEVKKGICALKCASPTQLVLTNGSDEAIDLLVRAFCEPGRDSLLIMPPTYGMYEVCAAVQGAGVERVNLTADFQIDAAAVLQRCDEPALSSRVKIVFACSPNNPSGNCLGGEDVLTIARSFSGIVVLDEAYADFAPSRSLLPRLRDFPNLVILQTFSKAWGMAGARLGMLFAHPEITAIINRIKPPYNVSELTQQCALDALQSVGRKDEMVRILIEQRNKLAAELASLPFVRRVYPSDANFLLVKMIDPGAVQDKLRREGIIVRDRSRLPLCEGCLRISVGTPEENAKLMQALSEFKARE